MLKILSIGSQAESSEDSSVSHYSHSVRPTLPQLLKKLYNVAEKWEDIGILIEIESDKLNNVKKENNPSQRDCLREMLKIWMKQVSPPPTWSSMADALETVGEEELAGSLREP